ncbi:LysR family transcriptional regulator [Salipiger thiooxidans]|uniref:LysR family transcriptional regulator n=1 Tax=Salipiger thiooxidans TaxID=282683 RepID=UPI001CD4044F|nr:LysR family transcriptional regulator [Salipiger thiooxidans]MCA0850270.1 LysR family transcriptional regulator [Salipiger thiooxidans]
MSDRLQAYEIFAELMDRKSFSETSRALSVPQATVSKQIVSLEAALGVQLFIRSTRRVSPTAEAEELIPHVRHMLDSHEEVLRVAHRELPSISGNLRIAAPHSYGRRVLLPILAEFMEQYPDLLVDVALHSRPPDLLDAKIDLAIIGSATLEGPYRQRLLTTHRWIIAGTPSYLKQHGRPSNPIDLEQHWLIVPRLYPSDVLVFDSEDGRQSVSFRSRLKGNDVEFAEGAAWQDAGLAVLPDWMLGFRPSLEPVLSDYVLAPIPIRLVFPEAKIVPRRVRALIEFLALRAHSA